MAPAARSIVPAPSCTRVGSGMPFRLSSPRSSKRKALPTQSSLTATETTMSPSDAAEQRRAASWTAAPKRSSLSSVTGSPAYFDADVERRRASLLRWWSRRCTWTANVMAETTELKEAMMPSPVCLTSRPGTESYRQTACSLSRRIWPSSPS